MAIEGIWNCQSCGNAFNSVLTKNQLSANNSIKCDACGKGMQFLKDIEI